MKPPLASAPPSPTSPPDALRPPVPDAPPFDVTPPTAADPAFGAVPPDAGSTSPPLPASFSFGSVFVPNNEESSDVHAANATHPTAAIPSQTRPVSGPGERVMNAVLAS